jgi:hypothetical protein
MCVVCACFSFIFFLVCLMLLRFFSCSYRDPVLLEDDVVIVISQSGETADTLAAVRAAKEAGVLCLGLVNAVGSTIARETDAGVYVGGRVGGYGQMSSEERMVCRTGKRTRTQLSLSLSLCVSVCAGVCMCLTSLPPTLCSHCHVVTY